MSVAIIIPILNEAANLLALKHNLAQLQPAADEVVLMDGSSTDDTVAQAQALGFTVLQAPRGRARQMNAGAQATTAELLLFLHVDTRLPVDALQQIQQADSHKHWGYFAVWIDDSRQIFSIISHLINLRSRLTAIATGDQAIFVSRALFEHVGGYKNIPLMEDIDLSRTLNLLSKPLCLRQQVLTSARRWQRYGIGTTILLMWRLRFLYWCGVPATQLAKDYHHD
jgi:rSAM/selenodomain-associated transferase 2